MSKIKFGTSGWRGIIADDFTFYNVGAVVQAISDYIKGEGEERMGIVLGRDFRFLGDAFSRHAARIACGNGIKAIFSVDPAPTPAISYAVHKRKTSGAINITASHNPFDYSGVKYSPKWGGPALPETTRWIEDRANELSVSGKFNEISEDEARSKGLWEDVDLSSDYLAALKDKIDFDVIKKNVKRVAYDPIFSAGLGYLDRILKESGINVVTINDNIDPYFGGHSPDPSEENLKGLSEIVRSNSDISMGLATDGDADRFGILDSDGDFIEPNYIIALLVDYLIGRRGFSGGAARSVATTHLVDAVCAHYGVECYETPVGFKYIGEYIADKKIAAGGEESAGFSIAGHVPEKDGIIACLLTLEMVAYERKSLKKLLESLYEKVGRLRTRRVNLKLDEGLEREFPKKMDSPPSEFGGKKITGKVTIDGNKFLLDDGSWILMRKSGTEPVVRIYAEAGSDEKLEKIIKSARDFILE